MSANFNAKQLKKAGAKAAVNAPGFADIAAMPPAIPNAPIEQSLTAWSAYERQFGESKETYPYNLCSENFATGNSGNGRTSTVAHGVKFIQPSSISILILQVKLLNKKMYRSANTTKLYIKVIFERNLILCLIDTYIIYIYIKLKMNNYYYTLK